jgi:hypothetical protein
VLYSAALLATFLATWLKAADGSKYLFGRSLVPSSSLAWFFVFGLFVRECFPSPLPAAVFILIHLLLSARAVEGMAIPSRPTKLMRGS